MLIIDQDMTIRQEPITILLEWDEALDLIEKLSYLLREPSWHHDHLYGPDSRLDLVVIYPDGTPKLVEPLQAIAEKYFETKAE